MASKGYLELNDELTHPQQLARHRCIAHRAWSEWLLKREEEYYRWLLPPIHMTDNLIYARECALGGAGIMLLPTFLTGDLLSNGGLVQVLPAWQVEGNELWLVYPSRKLNSPALARFIDYALQSPIFREFYQ